MRNELPKAGPFYNESVIINLDDKSGWGTHWVAYKKRGLVTIYFDSFGNLQPPKEVIHYLNRGKWASRTIKYNYTRKQKFNTVLCGHLCLKFLLENFNSPWIENRLKG
jgi:hypothetical protein